VVIVRLIGGLGSQMSSYAYAKVLASRGYEVKIDITAFKSYKLFKFELDNFNISLNISSKDENDNYKDQNIFSNFLNIFLSDQISDKILNKLGFKIYKECLVEETSHLFDKKFLNISKNSYVVGDFKSEKYFENIRNILLKEFTLKEPRSNYLNDMESIINNKKDSCFIHIRRGEMATNEKANKIHGVCSKDYYLKAIQYIHSKINDVHFFVFSDDIPWSKENINLNNVTFMENSGRNSPNEDIYLMSICNHSIIDHSAFCWWGAWLNQNLNPIVIAPKRWFSDDYFQNQSDDIYCKNWIKI
jgi:hypothetical protein